LYLRVARRQPDVSEEHIASIFRVEEYVKEENSRSRWKIEDGGDVFL
jgi:hypothetical protein